MCMVVV